MQRRGRLDLSVTAQAAEVARGIARKFEGLRLNAYLCPAGVWTIAFGATGADIHPGMTVTKEWAEERLTRDVMRFMAGTLKLCPQLANSPYALAALTDFSFNLGLGRLRASTLRRRVNEGDMQSAARELMKWTRGGGRVLPGLVARRAAEAALLTS